MIGLNVYWDTELVGRLAQVGARDMSFQYSGSYLATKNPRPISLSLPLQADAFEGTVHRSWYANLLP